jgi:hypothetical protein
VGGVGVIYTALYVGIAAISGIVLPLRKSLFQRMPAIVQKKIGPVPLMSLLGVVSFVGIIGILTVGQLIPAIRGGINPSEAAWTIGLFIAGLPFYYGVKLYRKRVNGIDLSLAYKETPPE